MKYYIFNDYFDNNMGIKGQVMAVDCTCRGRAENETAKDNTFFRNEPAISLQTAMNRTRTMCHAIRYLLFLWVICTLVSLNENFVDEKRAGKMSHNWFTCLHAGDVGGAAEFDVIDVRQHFDVLLLRVLNTIALSTQLYQGLYSYTMWYTNSCTLYNHLWSGSSMRANFKVRS